MNELITTVFVRQPLALPGSAKYREKTGKFELPGKYLESTGKVLAFNKKGTRVLLGRYPDST